MTNDLSQIKQFILDKQREYQEHKPTAFNPVMAYQEILDLVTELEIVEAKSIFNETEK